MKKPSKLSIVYLTICVFIISFTISILVLDKNNTEKITVSINNNYNIIDKNNKIEELQQIHNNNDIVGILSIPNTSIDEIVVKTTDNDYYLSHNIDKEYNIHGSIYMDYRINLDNSKKVIIFGHSSPGDDINTVPFNELEEYYSYDYYKEHKNINLILNNETRTYEIFSVYVETKDFSYMNLNFEDTDTWYNHILNLNSKSLYNTNISLEPTDEVLILQTCSNNKNYSKSKEKYLLVIAKRII